MKNNQRQGYILSLLLIGIFLVSYKSEAQVPMGQWRYHPPYHRAEQLAVTPHKVYCATEVSMFSYDKEDNSIERLSKINGFSDYGVSALSFSYQYNVLIVGYQNGNIDLLKNGEIINLADIKRKQMAGNKRINSIMLLDTYAYLACNFGIVVLNLEKNEIVDTYILGYSGMAYSINKLTNNGSVLWAATSKGIYYADLNNTNLLDFNNWKLETNIPDAENEFSEIIWFNNSLYAVQQTGNASIPSKLYQYDGTIWKHSFQNYSEIIALDTNGDKLLISSNYFLDVLSKNASIERHIFDYATEANPLPRMAIYDKDEPIVWIADGNNGLIKNIDSWRSESYFPEGPEYVGAYDISIEKEHINIASGGQWSRTGGYHFFKNKWTSYNENTIEGMDDFTEILSVRTDPRNPNRVFWGSNAKGLLETIDGKVVNRFDNSNSPLEGIAVDNEAPCRIWGMDFDSKGALWMTVQGVEHPIMKLSSTTEWDNLDKLNTKSLIGENKIEDLYITSTDQKWIIPRGKGIVVIGDEQKGEIRKFSINDREGVTKTSNVYALREDNNGAIWVGTDAGVFVYHNPNDVFEGSSFFASQPSIDKNDGYLYGLLKEEKVTAVAVDGANRKWFGTVNNGIYLISDDGSKELKHFNTENSPLPSNKILSVEINHKDGEVFFATDKGLISYKAEATAGSAYFGDVYVYPNPVRPDFDGMITITGLVHNANVKITDIAGNLVSESTALGGQAVWDGKTLSGRRVQTGVYLIFCTNDDGTETFVSKVLFIN